ncbi:MAG TPA: GAF domain-containing sensor histidine kinase [Solirubrobacteraceae bacterium]|jgi:signal transduction histidine kinase|nr:GAF domain-containing sensor histidine kinase [Solirubrobacteraceae bacterium]
MSAAARLRQLATESAERRVRHDLGARVEVLSIRRQQTVVAVSVVLFAAVFCARLSIHDPAALIANFYTVPIALLAIEFGWRAGLLASTLAFGLVFAWRAIDAVHVDVLGYVSRGAAFVLVGGVVGYVTDQLRRDLAKRLRAQHELALYTDELERSNQQLVRSVVRLEAYAQIARTVGGETELERVLALILEHGREIAGARGLLACLQDGERLAIVRGRGLESVGLPSALPRESSLVGQALAAGRPVRVTRAGHELELDQLCRDARSAILVPLEFRGAALGVLVGIDPRPDDALEAETEELLSSVAASAATAVATARSVASDRLRTSIEAAEQARGRWARELHDETLQGLGGVRMVLSSALERGNAGAQRDALAAAHEHLGLELQRLRDLISELRPAALDDLGLGPAIDTLIERQASGARFAVRGQIDLSGPRLARETENAVYRIVQEALTNAAKHAQAAHVLVRVQQADDRIEILVQDDGCGFDPASTNGGFGLLGMRERAVLAGGTMAVGSRPGGPTRVSGVLPLAG